MVSKIRFKNFKLFKNWQTLEIKPITILIGKNNSGKTAVLKLPVMISESSRGNINEAIKLDFDGIKLGSEYSDLAYNRKILPGEFLELEISNNTDDSTFAELKLKVKLPTDVIKEKSEIFKWEYFENNVIISEKDETSEFKGFVKNNEKLEDLFLNYDYLKALRTEPEEEYPFKNEEYKKIGLKGENTYHILIKSTINQDGVFESVSNWYKNNFENWSLEINDDQIFNSKNKKYIFSIRNNNIEPINLPYTGQGITQALPLITRSYMKDEEPVLIIMEEPESHLHPAAHGNLAQRFVESYLEDDNKRYLIETHSKNFILRLQALVADPEVNFSNNDIAVYYVDYLENEQLSILDRLNLNEFGEFDKWPEEIFNESYKELLLLKQKQAERDDSNH
jgi:predicted ATPase